MIGTMRIILLAFTLVFGVFGDISLQCIASETVLDFEKQIPGQFPRGWYYAWGDHGDDLVLISSDTAP